MSYATLSMLTISSLCPTFPVIFNPWDAKNCMCSVIISERSEEGTKDTIYPYTPDWLQVNTSQSISTPKSNTKLLFLNFISEN